MRLVGPEFPGCAASAGDDLVVDGQLTIRGITRPVELALEVNGFGPDPYGGTWAGFSATGEINRTDFGISANMAIPGGGKPWPCCPAGYQRASVARHST
jgi:hypothetical protein